MAARFWVGGTGPWNSTSTANWSATTGGASGASAPTTADTVTFDASSGTGTVTADATATAGAVTMGSANITVALSGAPTFTGLFTHTLGTLTLNNFDLTALTWSSSNTNVRTINFGTGRIVLTGNNATMVTAGTLTGLVMSGTPAIRMTYSGATGTRVVNWGTVAGGSETLAISLAVPAGTDSVTIGSAAHIKNLDFTGFTGTQTSSSYNVYGNHTLGTGMTVTNGAAGPTYAATSGTQTITCNGVAFNAGPIINGVGTTVALADALDTSTSRSITLTNGTFNTAGFAVSTGSIGLGAGTKTLTLGASTVTVAAAVNFNTNSAGLTVTASTATLKFTSGSAQTLSFGGFTWPRLQLAGAGPFTIAQSNTFADWTATVATTYRVTAGTTQTFSRFTLTGTVSYTVTIDSSSAGSAATLSLATGTISAQYLSIKDSTASGGAAWNAYYSTSVSGNTGWNITANGPPIRGKAMSQSMAMSL